MRIADVPYRSGIGALANSRLKILSNGEFSHFSAYVGVDDSTRGTKAAVRFEVYADGRLLAISRPMLFNHAATRIEADVGHAAVIEIIARQLKADVGNVVIAWADAKLD